MRNNKLLKILIPMVLVCCQFVLPTDGNKFKLEISGNFLFASPDHLNYLPETEQQYLLFYFDPIYDNKSTQGAFDSIKSLYSINTRVKYAIAPSLNVSVGFSYLWKDQINKYHVGYTRDEQWRTISDVLDYPEMATKVRATIPYIGIHYHFSLFQKLRVECSLAGGPIFATIKYNSKVSQSITSISSSTFSFWSSEKSMRMEGKGTGISLMGSVRLEQPISNSLGLSLEGGYAWQRVNKIKGNGSETIDGYQTSYNGEWRLVRENVETIWGQAQFVFPTNNPDAFTQNSENFILDLSVFYISMGFYIRF